MAFACNKVEESSVEAVQPELEEFVYTFIIGDSNKAADTKATFDSDANGLFLTWQDGDQLTTWSESTIGSNGTSYSTGDVNASDSPVTFTIRSYKAINKDDYIYATFPKLASPGSDPTAAPLNIPTSQQYVAGSYDAAAMPMVAAPFGISQAIDNSTVTESEESPISFYNLGSVIQLGIYSPAGTYATEKIQSIAVEATENLAGEFTFDMTAVKSDDTSTLAIDGLTNNKVTTEVEEVAVGTIAKENALNYYLVIAPGTYSGEITVTTDKAVYYYEFSDKTFNRAEVKKFIVNLEKTGARYVSSTSEKVFFNETFAAADGASGWSGSAAAKSWSSSACDNTGWTVTNGYLGDGCAKFGTSGKKGLATTPALGIETSTATLTFKAGAWSGDATTLNISITGGGSLDKSSVTMPNAAWGSFSATITGGGASTQITFTASTKNNARFFLDDVKVSGIVTTGKVRGSIESTTIESVSARGVSSSVDLDLADFDAVPTLTVVPDGTIVTAASIESVSTTSVTINYTVDPNMTASSRAGSIKVSKGLSQGTVTVNQVAALFSTTASDPLVLANTAEATKSCTVKSDFDWTIDDSHLTGATVSPKSFTYSDSQNKSITFKSSSANDDSTVADLGYIIITRTADGATLRINVSQAAAEEDPTASFVFNSTWGTNATAITTVGPTNGVSLTFDKSDGSTAPTYYTDDGVRTYAKNTIQVSGTDIVKVVFTFASDTRNKLASHDGLTVTGTTGTWTGTKTNSVTFAVSSTSGNQARITRIDVFAEQLFAHVHIVNGNVTAGSLDTY